MRHGHRGEHHRRAALVQRLVERLAQALALPRGGSRCGRRGRCRSRRPTPTPSAITGSVETLRPMPSVGISASHRIETSASGIRMHSVASQAAEGDHAHQQERAEDREAFTSARLVHRLVGGRHHAHVAGGELELDRLVVRAGAATGDLELQLRRIVLAGESLDLAHEVGDRLALLVGRDHQHLHRAAIGVEQPGGRVDRRHRLRHHLAGRAAAGASRGCPR